MDIHRVGTAVSDRLIRRLGLSLTRTFPDPAFPLVAS